MSLPPKNEKEYLEITESGAGMSLVGQKAHTNELSALYRQYGVRCRVDPDVAPGQDALRFAWGEDKAQIQEILDGYKSAKGS